MDEKCVHGIKLNYECMQCVNECIDTGTEFHRSLPLDVSDTLKQRESTYGNYRDQCIITQNIKQAMIQSRNWSSLSPDKKEALGMIAVKIGRILNGDPEHKDSWHDIEGFAKLIADVLEVKL